MQENNIGQKCAKLKNTNRNVYAIKQVHNFYRVYIGEINSVNELYVMESGSALLHKLH